MNKKLILTSFVALTFACPAMAAHQTTSTFPNAANEQYMQEDYTYTGAATSTNMAGVTSGTVYAYAIYSANQYTLEQGKYLPRGQTSLATCIQGSFCPGTHNGSATVEYSYTTPQGIQSCPDGYGNSAAGSSANTQCYRACAIGNMGQSFNAIAHATAVSGNDYYNVTATDTCIATECEPGWTATNGACVANNITISWRGVATPGNATTFTAIEGKSGGYTSQVSYSGNVITPQAAIHPNGRTFLGWKFSSSMSLEDLKDELGQDINTLDHDGMIIDGGVVVRPVVRL